MTYAYLDPCQIFNMEHFTKKINDQKLLTIFADRSILDAWKVFE